MTEHIQKSRLGLLLINKGLITQSQLDSALQVQLTTGLRLGEVLINQGILSERQLTKALKKQSRHRLWAGVLAVVLGPMSFGAFASQSTQQPTQDSQISQMSEYQGLKALDDLELASIDGKGFQTTQEALNSLIQQAQGERDNDKLGALDELVSLLNPIASVLDADISVKGVKQNHHKQTKLNADGSIELALPSEIKEIAFRNLRVKGDTSGRSFGDVVISNVRFSEQSSIRIRAH
ncbi:MAG: hypothetical protein HWE18_14845 [Gammaproteobacteria bacterium]|nr:hypothetical protein [Gammaproteobacteria bacterium]